MIKAAALKPVSTENINVVSNALTRRSQNIVIEYSRDIDHVPRAVEELAYRMFQMDADIRGLLNELRINYVNKKEDFHLSLKDVRSEAKTGVIDLFQNLYGVISEVHYCTDCDVLNGKLSLSPRAQGFITGQYMEIAIHKAVRDVLSGLEKKYGKPFRLYANTKVTTTDGRMKNEFDLIIENTQDSMVYMIEIKSGKNFRDFDKLARIGREYGIVPDRLLLIDNYLTTSQMETIEYFCEYYCANLEKGILESKLTAMLENDL